MKIQGTEQVICQLNWLNRTYPPVSPLSRVTASFLLLSFLLPSVFFSPPDHQASPASSSLQLSVWFCFFFFLFSVQQQQQRRKAAAKEDNRSSLNSPELRLSGDFRWCRSVARSSILQVILQFLVLGLNFLNFYLNCS